MPLMTAADVQAYWDHANYAGTPAEKLEHTIKLFNIVEPPPPPLPASDYAAASTYASGWNSATGGTQPFPWES